MPPPSTDLAETTERLVEQAFSCVQRPAPEGSVRLVMAGELDLLTADGAREAVRGAQDEAGAVLCDLADVWFVDLSGLSVLLDAARHARLTGGRLTLTNCPPIVPRMLRLLGLEDALEIQAAQPSAASSPGCAVIRPHVGRRG